MTEPERPDISIVIVATNERAVVLRCVQSVYAHPSRARAEILVVDNVSTDGLAVALRKDYPEVRIVTMRRKSSFPVNNNAAIAQSRGRYLLLLNPDSALLPGTLDTMAGFMDAHPRTAMSTCKLLYPDGTQQPNIRAFPTPFIYFLRISHLDRLWRFRCIDNYLLKRADLARTRQIDWCITAFFFVRRQALDEVGPLDEGFMAPFYCEDLDWCLRARQSGWELYYVAEAAAMHEYQRSSQRLGKLTFVHFCNICRLFVKHAGLFARGIQRLSVVHGKSEGGQ